MADPLSIAASIIAVVGAVRVTIKSLERLIALKDAPALIKQLSTEVCRYRYFLINGSSLFSLVDLRNRFFGAHCEDRSQQ